MENNCPNCNRVITGNFCSNCGQKKYKRIDKNYIWEEIQYTILHTNKGFLYSVKEIIKNPGKTAREYLDGNRGQPLQTDFACFCTERYFGFCFVQNSGNI